MGSDSPSPDQLSYEGKFKGTTPDMAVSFFLQAGFDHVSDIGRPDYLSKKSSNR
jgi:hypothetical protein